MLCCLSSDTLQADDVPEEFREPAIRSGYRRPGISFYQCLVSLFTLHNETLNVWTHLISFSFYVHYLLYHPLPLWRPEYHAILCLLVTCCLFPLGSALAHLFNSMSPVARHVCFMVDYLTISLYAFGACLTNKIYALPKSWRHTPFEDYFLYGNFINCFFCVFISCHTRFLPRNKSTKVLRLSAFALPYFFGMLPCMHRVLYCEEDDSCDGAAYYAQHFFDTIFTVSFYGGHIPEVFFPGCFDIFGQSHSIFHVVVVIGTFHHVQGNIVDMVNRPLSAHSPLPVTPLVPLLTLAVLNTITVIYFGYKMSHLKKSASTNSLSATDQKKVD